MEAKVLKLIANSSSHRIVKLLYHCEITKDYSLQNQYNYLISYN
jgi:hypothetical protein